MAVEAETRFGGPRVLIGALAWRARREGPGYLLVGLAPFVLVIAAVLVPSAIFGGSVNGGSTYAAFASRYGAHADAVTVGLGLLVEPGIVAFGSAVAVGLLVRNLVGSESSRGGMEALLAGPYRPRSIMVALLGYAGLLATFYWAAMTVLAAAALAIVIWASGASLSLTPSYLLVVVVLPLLSAWATTGLSLLVALLYPWLTQAGNYGLNLAGGGVGSLPALLPALGMFLVFTIWAAHISPQRLLVIAGGATALIAVGSIAVVAHRFRPDAVLES